MLRVIQQGDKIGIVGNAEAFRMMREIICDRSVGGDAYAERFVGSDGTPMMVVGLCCEEAEIDQIDLSSKAIEDALQELLGFEASKTNADQ